MELFSKIVGWLWGPPLIIMMTVTGLYFTIGSGFFQFSKFGHIMKKTFGSIVGKEEDEGGEGLLSSFEAISVAIGGSVGVANIGGVATAVAVGGPGAIFWMWMSALLGMVLKMAEVTLSVYYRNKDENGVPFGGPTFYMEKGLGEERGIKIWPVLAVIFGAGIFSTFFLTLQNYTVSEAIGNTFGISLITVSVIYVICTYLIISGGIPSLGKAAAKIVPFMCLFYIIGGLIIIFKNITLLPQALSMIVKGAFTGTAAVGGFAGIGAMKALQLGMARAVYSNEAGWGTSPMIHATAKVEHPVKQGLWGAFEVFIDTIVVCTITALVVIMTGQWSTGLDGATLALTAFEVGLGRFGRIIIAFSIFLLGLSTTTGWYAYYEVILRHLFKNRPDIKDNILKVYRWVYPIPGMLLVIMAVTSGLPGAAVWLFGDFTSAIPTFANVITILILSPVFFKLIKDYKARYLGIGKVDPEFEVFYEDKKEKTSR
ncbi:MAG TPA: sodium:alanine symporter family protein [Tissierellia bacterium]|nr:sodium:alanine symporter family protein [Tissierellia bacterium]